MSGHARLLSVRAWSLSHIGLVHHTAELVDDLAILKEEDSREGFNPIALRRLGLGLHIQRGDRRLASKRLCQSGDF